MKSKKVKKILIALVAIVLVGGIIGGGTAIWYYNVPPKMKYKTETVEPKSKDKIKVGILSDLQLPQVEEHLYTGDYQTVTNGPAHFIRALKFFKEQGVDMVILNGDTVNAVGDYAAYSAYNKVLDEVYGEDRADMPHFIYPMGNHEFYGAYQEAMYYHGTGLPLNARTVIGGYSFISISNSKLEKKDYPLAKELGVPADGAYSAKRINFLKEQLAVSAKESPEKPIFVFLHMPIDAAIAGGHWATPQYKDIYEVLKQYPQAVVFTSHSHYCLDDERSIVQKDFTMINTGTASYFDFDWLNTEDKTVNDEPNKFYGLTDQDLLDGTKEVLRNRDYLIHPEILGIESTNDVPNRNDVNNGFIMEIDTVKNSFTLQKMNFNTCLPFGTPFTMNAYTKDSFTRTPEQIGQGTVAKFTGNEVNAEVQGSNVVVTFRAAEQNIPTKYYLYELEDENGRVTPIRFFAKSYILGSETPYYEQNILHNLQKGTYKLRIYAVNSYNLQGDTCLSTGFTVA